MSTCCLQWKCYTSNQDGTEAKHGKENWISLNEAPNKTGAGRVMSTSADSRRARVCVCVQMLARSTERSCDTTRYYRVKRSLRFPENENEKHK